MKQKSHIFRNTLVLLLITFVAVTALAFVNQITLDPIAQAEIRAREASYQVVAPDAKSFEDVEISESDAAVGDCTIDNVCKALDASGAQIGYVICATTPQGYGGNIQIALGINTDGVITGFDVISHSETPGFGAKSTDEEFKSQFAGKPATALTFNKDGNAGENEFDAISGATFTSTAIQDVIGAATEFCNTQLKGE